MYLKRISHYIPTEEVPNSFFKDVNGLSDDWITARTGIKSRRKASAEESTNTMSVEAAKLLETDLSDVDLIISASYTPNDTIVTAAHTVQRTFNIDNAQAVYVSSACSSLVNAMEIVEGYFAIGKAQKALLIAADQNWSYCNPSDEKSGHLWGDGATAMLLTKEKSNDSIAKIVDVHTRGLGHIGKGPEGVYLDPKNDGLCMPNGRDVFIHACNYMEEALQTVLDRNNIDIKEVDNIIPHQANHRIIQNLEKRLNKTDGSILSNIDRLGNTGCASTGICLSENIENLIAKKAMVGVTVFGGGYSSGAMLLKFE